MVSDNRVYCVYVLFRPWNGDPAYVGKGKDKRHLEYRRDNANYKNRHLKFILDKAKRLELEVPMIVVRDNLTEEEAFLCERALIAGLGRKDLGLGTLANGTDGGEGASGYKQTEEHKKKIGAVHRGKQVSSSTREKLRLTWLGKTLSDEHKAKVSAALRGRECSSETRKKIRETGMATRARRKFLDTLNIDI